MSYATQWTQPLASGSSTMSAKATVPAGGPDQASGGDTSWASQVWRLGIAPPSANAVLVNVKRAIVSTSGRGLGLGFWPGLVGVAAAGVRDVTSVDVAVSSADGLTDGAGAAPAEKLGDWVAAHPARTIASATAGVPRHGRLMDGFWTRHANRHPARLAVIFPASAGGGPGSGPTQTASPARDQSEYEPG